LVQFAPAVRAVAGISRDPAADWNDAGFAAARKSQPAYGDVALAIAGV
jgi:hypothetical protein